MPEQPSAQEIMAQQGTRLSETPPWMSYAAEFEEKLSPQMEAEVSQYAQHRHGKSSSENEEELCRQREINTDLAKQYQWLHPREYADDECRVGVVLSYEDFINKLRGGGPQGSYGSHGCGLRVWYRNHPHADKVTLVYSNVWGTDAPELACWAQYGLMPEYSMMNFDQYGAPLAERRRGWRTCLLQMILKGIVSETRVNDVFGAAYGPASERYNRTLFEFRKAQLEAVEE